MAKRLQALVEELNGLRPSDRANVIASVLRTIAQQKHGRGEATVATVGGLLLASDEPNAPSLDSLLLVQAEVIRSRATPTSPGLHALHLMERCGALAGVLLKGSGAEIEVLRCAAMIAAAAVRIMEDCDPAMPANAGG